MRIPSPKSPYLEAISVMQQMTRNVSGRDVSLLGGANGDGAQRGTVTIPVLAPYANHVDQP